MGENEGFEMGIKLKAYKNLEQGEDENVPYKKR